MSFSVPVSEWKPKESAGKRSQVEMPFLAGVAELQQVPHAVVAASSFNGCLIEAARYSGKEDQEIADEIHISHGYMSRFMRGVAQQWAKRLVAFMRATQSLAPLQWIANQMGCDITLRSVVSAELAAARARVAELERAGRVAA